jgi:hypothetical protein
MWVLTDWDDPEGKAKLRCRFDGIRKGRRSPVPVASSMTIMMPDEHVSDAKLAAGIQ